MGAICCHPYHDGVCGGGVVGKNVARGTWRDGYTVFVTTVDGIDVTRC